MDTMKKTVFEEMKITYREENGYLIPNLAMPKQTDYPIGKYGRLRLDFIKKHRQGTYTTLLTQGRRGLHAEWFELSCHTCPCKYTPTEMFLPTRE